MPASTAPSSPGYFRVASVALLVAIGFSTLYVGERIDAQRIEIAKIRGAVDLLERGRTGGGDPADPANPVAGEGTVHEKLFAAGDVPPPGFPLTVVRSLHDVPPSLLISESSAVAPVTRSPSASRIGKETRYA